MKLHFRDGKLLAVLAAIVAAAAVATSIWLNPPSEIRARALDQARLRGLKSTEDAIKTYYDAHRALPVELQVLENENNHLVLANWHDPETQRPYEYNILSETSYRLCAVFSRSSDKSDRENNLYDYSFKKHSAGRDCFQQSVSPHEKQ